MRFQKQAAQHIGQMGAELAALDAVTPQLLQRALHIFQLPRHLGLAAGHQRHKLRLMP